MQGQVGGDLLRQGTERGDRQGEQGGDGPARVRRLQRYRPSTKFRRMRSTSLTMPIVSRTGLTLLASM